MKSNSLKQASSYFKCFKNIFQCTFYINNPVATWNKCTLLKHQNTTQTLRICSFYVVITLASWAFRSLTSASSDLFSPSAVERDASLEFSRASRSFSLARADSRSASFLPFLQSQKYKDSIKAFFHVDTQKNIITSNRFCTVRLLYAFMHVAG